MKKFNKLLNSKNRCVDLGYLNKKVISKVQQVILKSLGKKINLQNRFDLEKLTLKDIKKIDKNLRTKYQRQLVNILKPEIFKISKQILEVNDFSDFRVGAVCKYKKIKVKKKKNFNKEFLSFDPKRLCEAKEYANQTPAHQDLPSTAYRSSSTFIFYIQITPNHNESSLLEISKFKNKVGLYDVSKTFKFDRLDYVIGNKIVRKKKWIVPTSIKPYKIMLMDSMTLHKSTETGTIPRIAINVKIPPKNLNYLYKIYGFKKKFTKSNILKNLNILEKDLNKMSKKNNALNFELSVLSLLKNDLLEAKKRLQKLCLYKLNKKKINTFFTGSVLRLAQEEIRNSHIKKFKTGDYKIAKLSCANSILNTFK